MSNDEQARTKAAVKALDDLRLDDLQLLSDDGLHQLRDWLWHWYELAERERQQRRLKSELAKVQS